VRSSSAGSILIDSGGALAEVRGASTWVPQCSSNDHARTKKPSLRTVKRSATSTGL